MKKHFKFEKIESLSGVGSTPVCRVCWESLKRKEPCVTITLMGVKHYFHINCFYIFVTSILSFDSTMKKDVSADMFETYRKDPPSKDPERLWPKGIGSYSPRFFERLKKMWSKGRGKRE